MSDTNLIKIPDELLDPVWRLSNMYQIRTKIEGEEGEDVMFEPNRVQRKIYQAIEDGWKRIIILKPRKLGVTTAISLYMLDKTLYHKNQICRTIAHRRETAGELFSDIASHSFEQIKKNAPELIIVKQKAGSTRELAFDNGSAYSIDVEARGKTPTILHFTEVAYFEDEKKFEDSLISLPRTALGIFESTANGKGNWFEKEFTRNWEILKAGGTPKIYPMFFAWFDDPNNVEKWNEGTALNYPEECAEMQARFNLSREQVLWWDSQKWSYGDRLSEVYPSTPEEAFIFSTGLVYGTEFREELNVIPPMNFDDYRLALDYGQTNPMVILATHRDYDGNFIVFKELYGTNLRLEQVRKWLEMNCMNNMDKAGYFHIHYPDPSVFNETRTMQVVMTPGQPPPKHRYSIADEFYREAKIILHRGAENDVPTGITRVKNHLKFDLKRVHPFRRINGQPTLGSPRLFITENCKNLRDEFRKYRWPKDPAGALTQHSYEVPIKDHDHALDALRYTILSWSENQRSSEVPPPANTIAYHEFVTSRLERQYGLRAGEAEVSEAY